MKLWQVCMGASTAAVLLAPGAARAVSVIDLTIPGSSAVVNGATFEQTPTQATGSGVGGSFLRVQADGTEEGYNTSGGTPLDDKSGVSLNNGGLTVGDLTYGTFNGISQTQIVLDSNEPQGGTDRFGQPESLISLDSLQIYVGSVAGLTTTNLSALGTKVYDLGATPVLIDTALSSGSGSAAVGIWFPKTIFAGASATDSVYLYAHFGNVAGSADGYEEFLLVNNMEGSTGGTGGGGTGGTGGTGGGTGGTGGGGGMPGGGDQPGVPEPVTMALLPMALVGLGIRRRMRV